MTQLDLPTTDLGSRAAKGVAWNVVARLVNPAIILVTQAVLARLLNPSAFGIVGTARVVTTFATVLSDGGLSAAVIQRRDLTQAQVSGAFWLNLILNALAALGCFAVAGCAASYFDQPLLSAVLPVAALGFLLTAGGSMHIAILQRRLQIRVLALRTLVGSLVGGVTSILLAALGMGVWSLVWGAVATSAAVTVLLWISSGWRPSLSLRWAPVRPVVGFALPLAGTALLGFLGRNGDSLIVAKLLGAAALGQYQMAYTLFMLPMAEISGALGGVLLPTLSALQDDLCRLREGYLRVVRLANLLGLPLVVLIAGSGPALLPLVIGTKWRESAELLRWLVIPGMLQLLLTWGGTTLTAAGRPRTCLLINLLNTPSLLGCAWVGAHYGLTGVAVGLNAHFVLVTPWSMWHVMRALQLPLRPVLAALTPGYVLGTAVGLPAVVTHFVNPPFSSPWVWEGTRVALSVLALAVTALTIGREWSAQVWSLVRTMTRR